MDWLLLASTLSLFAVGIISGASIGYTLGRLKQLDQCEAEDHVPRDAQFEAEHQEAKDRLRELQERSLAALDDYEPGTVVQRKDWGRVDPSTGGSD